MRTIEREQRLDEFIAADEFDHRFADQWRKYLACSQHSLDRSARCDDVSGRAGCLTVVGVAVAVGTGDPRCGSRWRSQGRDRQGTGKADTGGKNLRASDTQYGWNARRYAAQ